MLTTQSSSVNTLESEVITPLVSFTSFAQFEQALRDSRVSAHSGASFSNSLEVDRLVKSARELYGRGLPPIVSSRTFSLLFGVSPRLISAMTKSPEKYWRTFEIKKRSGKGRNIAAPRVFLKTVQRFLLRFVLEKIPIHPNAFGFAPGKGIFKHAERHLKARFVLTLDIADFFPSISWTQVRDIFANIGFPDGVPSLLADLCTRNKVFPQGAPTSPYLSNLIFLKTDEALTEAANQFEMRYSRYADDLTFSCDSQPSDEARLAFEQIIRDAGFRIQHSKTRLRGPSQAREVTGLLVNEKIQPSRHTRRLLRAKFHNLLRSTSLEQETLPSLGGWASYVNSYDVVKGEEYLSIVRSKAR